MNDIMFPFINKGSSRAVYAINDNLVLKLARYYTSDMLAVWGKDQCKTELETYLKYGKKLPLCKVYVDLCTDQRIVMERVIPLSEYESDLGDGYSLYGNIHELIRRLEHQIENDDPDYMDSLNPVMKSFAKKILESGLTRNEISSILCDVDFSNMGIKNNELVILDFGIRG